MLLILSEIQNTFGIFAHHPWICCSPLPFPLYVVGLARSSLPCQMLGFPFVLRVPQTESLVPSFPQPYQTRVFLRSKGILIAEGSEPLPEDLPSKGVLVLCKPEALIPGWFSPTSTTTVPC